VGRGRIALYVIAHAAIWAAALAPVLVALPIRVEALAPDDTSKALSLILAAGGIVALASPGLGWLSDRTRRRTGSRRPWLLGGMLIACVASVLLAAAESVAQLAVAWCVAQVGLSLVIVTLMAVLVDTVPPPRRGVVAGLLGVGPPIGAVTGTWLLDAVSDSQTLLFVAPTALAAVAVGAFALVLPSTSTDGDRHPAAARRQPRAPAGSIRRTTRRGIGMETPAASRDRLTRSR